MSTSKNRLGTVNNGSQTWSADFVNGGSDSVVTKARLNGNLTSRVLANVSAVNVTKDDFLDISRLDFRNLLKSGCKKPALANFQLFVKKNKIKIKNLLNYRGFDQFVDKFEPYL